jgi:gamma-glutamyltranspeptidase / glutathione hydrolase
MVATSSAPATRVGVEVLRRGGNAVDAAVAVGLALAVTYPSAGNLGGGGFMLVRLADGRTTIIDFREVAPLRAHARTYLDARRRDASTVGHLAAGMPGTVAGLALARERFGTRPWRELVEPARRLAAEGFLVSHALARDLRASKALPRFAESRRVYLRGGRFWRAGERFRQPELAATLGRLQRHGPREFYTGRTARLIAREMRASGGLITLEDLRRYRPVVRQPLRGRYRGYEIVTMPPPSSGGVALLEMLGVLERFPIAQMGAGSSATVHLMVEAMRRAFADRAAFLGDPAFTSVPVARLTSPAYAAELARSIDPRRATPSGEIRAGQPASVEPEETTHYSIVDRHGNAVAVTYTLNGSYGSGVTVRGAGFLLNNEMDDFTTRPGAPNLFGLVQGPANNVAPGKRPLSSMTPAMVLRDGRLRWVLGSPGGPTIINTVFQVIVNLADHRMPLWRAVSEPRLHHQWLPDEIVTEPHALPVDVRRSLLAKGHRFARRSRLLGDVQAIEVDPSTGARIGVSDPRSPDALAAGH